MAERKIEPPRFCSRCGKPIVVIGASFCKECGAPLAHTVVLDQADRLSPWAALILSLIPGLGHWYKSLRKRAVLWFIVVTVAYGILFPIGLAMHVICAVNAAIGGTLPSEALGRGIDEARRAVRSASMSRASR
jgi:hypothetical protein